MAIFYAGIILLVVSLTIVLIRLYRNKDFVSGSIICFLFIGLCYLSFGFGVKSVHIRYRNAYYVPTKKLFSHFSKLVDSKKMNQIAIEIKALDKEFEQINWSDETTYLGIINKVQEVQGQVQGTDK